MIAQTPGPKSRRRLEQGFEGASSFLEKGNIAAVIFYGQFDIAALPPN